MRTKAFALICIQTSDGSEIKPPPPNLKTRGVKICSLLGAVVHLRRGDRGARASCGMVIFKEKLK
jgi:hypothetical protein